MQRLVADGEFDLRGIAGDDLDLKARLAVADVEALQDVRTGRYVGEEEGPLSVANPRSVEPLDNHGSPTNRLAAFGVDCAAGERASLGTRGGIYRQAREEKCYEATDATASSAPRRMRDSTVSGPR